MSKLTIQGTPLPLMPWEERPIGCKDTLWRYSHNPVIPRDLLPDSNSIFNSAVVPFGEGFAGVFRVDDKNRRMTLHAGFSKDGLHWDLEPEPLRFECDIPEVADNIFPHGLFSCCWLGRSVAASEGAARLDEQVHLNAVVRAAP